MISFGVAVRRWPGQDASRDNGQPSTCVTMHRELVTDGKLNDGGERPGRRSDSADQKDGGKLLSCFRNTIVARTDRRDRDQCEADRSPAFQSCSISVNPIVPDNTTPHSVVMARRTIRDSES